MIAFATLESVIDAEGAGRKFAQRKLGRKYSSFNLVYVICFMRDSIHDEVVGT